MTPLAHTQLIYVWPILMMTSCACLAFHRLCFSMSSRQISSRDSVEVIINLGSAYKDVAFSQTFNHMIPKKSAGHNTCKKGVITTRVFSLEESPETLNSLNSLEFLEYGRIVLVFHTLGGTPDSLESPVSKFSRISRKWSGSPLFSTLWGLSSISSLVPRISRFSRIARKWTFLKGPLFQKTPSSDPDYFSA